MDPDAGPQRRFDRCKTSGFEPVSAIRKANVRSLAFVEVCIGRSPAARTFAEDPSPPKLAAGFKPVQLPLVEILRRPA